MIQNADGSVTLEEGERINIDKEIEWLVNDWLADDPCHGVLIFSGGGRSAGYLLMPYRDPKVEKAA